MRLLDAIDRIRDGKHNAEFVGGPTSKIVSQVRVFRGWLEYRRGSRPLVYGWKSASLDLAELDAEVVLVPFAGDPE